MDIFTIVFWFVAVTLLLVSLYKDKEKTMKAFNKSKKSVAFMIPSILSIVFLIGLILTYLPPESITEYFGDSSSLQATITSALIGSITLIPAFVAFPLVASFIDLGASIVPGAAFLTTLTMVGVITFPLERDKFGTKFALFRNSLSFVFAVIIALLMGVIL